MNILSLKEGDEITINAVGKDDRLEFKSKVIEPYGNTLIIQEITNENNEAISFMSENVYLEMSSMNSKNLPIIWKNVEIHHVRIGKEYFHRVIQSEDGKIFNRRTAFRLPIDRTAVIQKGANGKSLDVLMHDVSTSGFSFITDEDFEIGDIDAVHIMCTYDDFRINLNGALARKQKLSTGKFLYGAKTSVINRALDKFIMEKQRQKLSVTKKPSPAVKVQTQRKIL